MADNKAFNETEAGLSGYQALKKVGGVLVRIEKITPPPNPKITFAQKDQIEFELQDAEILEMFQGADTFELKDGKFTGRIPYALPGKTKAHQNSTYIKCWVASAKEQGKTPADFIGQYVVLERQARVLFQDKDEQGNKFDVLSVDKETGIPFPSAWCFSADTAQEDIGAYVTKLVVGKTPEAALRAVMMDTRASKFPEYKDALKNGLIAEKLPVKLVDGLIQAV